MGKEGVSLPSFSGLILLGSFRVRILLFSSTHVLTEGAPSQWAGPLPPGSFRLECHLLHAPNPKRSLQWLLRLGTSLWKASRSCPEGRFPAVPLDHCDQWPLPLSNKFRISGLRGHGLRVGAALCIFCFCILHRALFTLFIPLIILYVTLSLVKLLCGFCLLIGLWYHKILPGRQQQQKKQKKSQ